MREEHAFDVQERLAPPVVAAALDEVGEELWEIAAHEADEGRLGVDRERLLHEGEREDLRIGELEAPVAGTVLHGKWHETVVEVVEEAVDDEKQLLEWRRSVFDRGHGSRRLVGKKVFGDFFNP